MKGAHVTNLAHYVEQLARAETRYAASRALLNAGPDGTNAVLDGLSHPWWQVRRWCCRYLDHQPLDERMVRRLTAALRDPNRKVRAQAGHALACEGCQPATACSVA